MGLDISVISNIKPMDLPEGMKKWSEEYYNWEEEEGKEFWSPYNMAHFERHSEGLPDSELVYSDDGEYFSFRAGSYSGYGEWRNDLAIAAGYEGGSEEVWMKADGGEYGFPFVFDKYSISCSHEERRTVNHDKRKKHGQSCGHIAVAHRHGDCRHYKSQSYTPPECVDFPPVEDMEERDQEEAYCQPAAESLQVVFPDIH